MFFRKIILVSLALISISAGVHAAPIDEVLPFSGDEWDKVPEIVNLPQANLRDEFLPIVARFLIFGMAFVAFVIFFAAGAWLVLGWGEEDSIKKAKNAMVWAVVGLGFAATSYLLVKGVVDLGFGWEEDDEVTCDDLVADGLLGPDTYEAIHEKTPNLAGSFIEEDKADCRDTSKLETVEEMPIRQSGDLECTPVLDFQEAYNDLECDLKTGEKIDIEV